MDGELVTVLWPIEPSMIDWWFTKGKVKIANVMSPPIQKCLGLTGKDELEEIKNERHIIYQKRLWMPVMMQWKKN